MDGATTSRRERCDDVIGIAEPNHQPQSAIAVWRIRKPLPLHSAGLAGGLTCSRVPLIPVPAILVAHVRHNMAVAGSDLVSLIRPKDRVEGDPTPGMIREQAVFTEDTWAGLVRTEPRMVSGWHHHGDYETSIYVTSGAL